MYACVGVRVCVTVSSHSVTMCDEKSYKYECRGGSLVTRRRSQMGDMEDMIKVFACLVKRTIQKFGSGVAKAVS